jgi:hypothetical protein
MSRAFVRSGIIILCLFAKTLPASVSAKHRGKTSPSSAHPAAKGHSREKIRRLAAAETAADELVGTWRCVAPGATPGVLILKADGSYVTGNVKGHYARKDHDVVFDGAIKDWYSGQAVLKDGLLTFYWKNADGSMNFFAFAKE